ncbi:MAG: hypothetical protein CO105_05520 [Comamonadaceae bacterium CG_4_9_14_3_um_filter_60_33]|nr:MAG: hypothetical protein COZ09_01795 [Comamonadaceae bacterium CG_4_10_14_3_um_filter_60_42]PJB44706.1 MAG: hypothetical protein CO105_05520 [Comamonadaceae bacterium CG_4_9_14_3_um_filter_60_33]
MLVRGLRGLQHLGLNLTGAVSALYAVLMVVAVQSGVGPLARWSLIGIALLAVVAWLANLRRARAIAELATSRISSAAQGYVELVGRASVDPENLIFTPLGGIACIWYRYRLYSRDNAKREWRKIDSGVSSSTFDISDPTGVCTVDPDHAEVVGAKLRTSYPGNDKLVEELLFGGTPIYVLGDFSTLGGASIALNLREDVGALLTRWKQDRVSLHQRFDLDRNGNLDLQEWELARQLATQTVARQHRDIRQQPGVHLLRAPKDGRLFLISALSPQALRNHFLRWSAFHLTMGMAAVAYWLYLA